MVISTSKTEILAENVDFDTYMRDYAEQHAEWIDGIVIKMSPVSGRHDEITSFINTMLRYYLEKTNEGIVRAAPFVMKPTPETRGREPDVLVVTTPNADRLKETYVEGAADLVVEVVSPDSIARDRGEKFDEYQLGDVGEYWIVDPVHQETLFYVLGDDGHFQPNPPDANGTYTSRILPRLRFPAKLLIQRPVPGIMDAVNLVNEMLRDA